MARVTPFTSCRVPSEMTLAKNLSERPEFLAVTPTLVFLCCRSHYPPRASEEATTGPFLSGRPSTWQLSNAKKRSAVYARTLCVADSADSMLKAVQQLQSLCCRVEHPCERTCLVRVPVKRAGQVYNGHSEADLGINPLFFSQQQKAQTQCSSEVRFCSWERTKP